MNKRHEMKYEICHITFNSLGKLPPLYNELVMLSKKCVPAIVYNVKNEADETHFDLSLPHIRIHDVSIFLRFFSVKQTGFLKLIRFVEYILRAFFFALVCRYRIIVAHDLAAVLPAYFAARIRRKKIIYNAHELWSETNGMTAPFPGLWKKLDLFFCGRVDGMITPEENRARIYCEEYGAKNPPVVAANCPLYRPAIRSRILRDFLAERGAEVSTIALYQGIFDPGRCLHFLIEAMKDVDDDAALILMGRGNDEQRASLENRISALGLKERVFMHPFVPYDRLHEYSCSADIGVLLYKNDCRNNYYCAPNKLYEYLHAGLPVITSNFPGLKASVEGEQIGICVNPESASEIAKALNYLSDSRIRMTMRQRALQLAEKKYNWENEFEKIFKLYQSDSRIVR